ncbi:MAG: glycosyl transferase family 90 [Bacteroidota bacterium]
MKRYEKVKLFYFLESVWMLVFPYSIYRSKLKNLLSDPLAKSDEVIKRVSYYNKLVSKFKITNEFISIKDFKLRNHKSAYFFDTLEYIRYFNKSFKFKPLFGDITYIPETPSIVKSRPVNGNNANSVLLNLDKYRHFNFINDSLAYNQKIDMLVWRGHVSEQKQNRIDFLSLFSNNPLCDVGYTNNWNGNPKWKKEWMTIAQQLRFKFILCLEGVDVATNLKWVMSSNSIAVSTKPKYETWFMEGTLIPDYHYIEVADDFSDLEEKIKYYIQNPDKSIKIIDNAHQYVNQFKNKKVEKIISLMVLDKYFSLMEPD